MRVLNGAHVYLDGELVASGAFGESTRVIFDSSDDGNRTVLMKSSKSRGGANDSIVTPKSTTTQTPNGYTVVFDSGRYYENSAYENTLWCSSTVTPVNNHYVITRGVNGIGKTLYTSGRVYSNDMTSASYGYASCIDYRHYTNVIQRSNWGDVY